MLDDKFPKDFLWGSATSSHQVEGGQTNDWTDWESEGNVRNREVSGKADDDWHLFKKDIDLVEKLNLKAYRFSIEWSRIEPLAGDFQQEAINHYRKEIKDLRKRGIEPMVTLHHFTHPTWLSNWTRSKNIDYFERYVRYVVTHLGEDVTYWCTINEPNVLVSMGYQLGIWPPGRKNPVLAWRAQKNLRKAHKKAYSAIHEIYQKQKWSKAEVGMSFNLHYFGLRNRNLINRLIAKVASYVVNHFTIRDVVEKLDYLGINYYFSHRVSWLNPTSVTNINDKWMDKPKSDLGWNVDPYGLYQLLVEFKKYNLPIIVTESGIADGRDALRERYIVRSVMALRKALSKGVNVKGYLHWALMDNFEWQEGYFGQFGLFKVDLKTQKRTMRDSAKVYGQIVKNNGHIPKDLEEKYKSTY